MGQTHRGVASIHPPHPLGLLPFSIAPAEPGRPGVLASRTEERLFAQMFERLDRVMGLARRARRRRHLVRCRHHCNALMENAPIDSCAFRGLVRPGYVDGRLWRASLGNACGYCFGPSAEKRSERR